ncbi:prepilin-type N-terminal cleavage/methylation domain-containing protein [Alteromonas pelagimontana]|uniref:Prepilin-type N-terminal cleavage/methylation domain-containing protein n=1 Tax=Alteromonas pelagimontana TaxID=1858656 RepID=A0A6M4MGK4_9ALTE|nr:PilW family protein [Alteromonas pelagimontana]QJR82077.1 prepilin-type N-terminal cleavage/methylation domain-containing protein [Alteromonas pelagimontana]
MTRQQGFSLVELMISLVLGLIISGAIIQTMVSSRVTNSLNQAVAQVQESGRFIVLRLTRELLEVGRYDQVKANVDSSVDMVVEAAFVQNRPVAVPGDFPANRTLGSAQGASGANDTLVVNLLAKADCAGNSYGYATGSEFHVANRYSVVSGKLQCTGFDGRVLRGLKTGAAVNQAVTLMDNVVSFQVQYGVTAQANTSEGQAVRYVTADELAGLRTQNQQVVAIRFGVLLQSDSANVNQTTTQQYALLNENPVTTDKQHYFQVFTQTLGLRNMKNFVRSAQ